MSKDSVLWGIHDDDDDDDDESASMIRDSPVLNDILKIDIQSDVAMIHMQKCFFDTRNPRSTPDYYVLKHYLGGKREPQVRQITVRCVQKDEECDIAIEFEKEASLFRHHMKQIDREKTKCWVFYITILHLSEKGNKAGHRICAYYFPGVYKNTVALLDSSHFIYDSWMYKSIVNVLRDFFGHETVFKNATVIKRILEYRPQNKQIIDKRKVRFLSPYLVKNDDTCALWARFMYIVGFLLEETLTIDKLDSFIAELNRSVFRAENFIVRFQIFIAKFIPDEFSGLTHPNMRKSKRRRIHKESTSVMYIDRCS